MYKLSKIGSVIAGDCEVEVFKTYVYIQWKPLIMITLGPALFDNNNRLITLSGG